MSELTKAEPYNEPHKNGTVTEGENGSRDENKICSIQVPVVAASLAEVLTVGGSAYLGLVESGRTWASMDDGTGSYLVTITFKGYMNDAQPAEEETEQWSMDFDFSEEPIEAHPKIQEIAKEFGGFKRDDDTYGFPEFMPSGSTRKGLSGKSTGSKNKNPMFGVKTYALMQARVSRSYSTKKITSKLLSDVGSVVRSIPNAPDNFNEITPSDRNWLVQPPKITQNGDVFRVEQEWLLSPPGGWPEVVYELIDK